MKTIMANTLKFKTIYKSITRFPDTELPQFVVLTGRNGCGKTHLLEAISVGSVSSSLVNDLNTDVRLYDWNSIVPNDTGVFNPASYQNKKSNWFNKIRTEQEKALPALREELNKFGLPVERFSSLRQILSIDESVLKQYIDDPEKREEAERKIKQNISNQGKNIYKQVRRNINDDEWKKVAPSIAEERPDLFLETSESNFFSYEKFLWGEVDVFQQAFGRLFSEYRDLIHQNDRLERYPPKGEGAPRHLNEKEFKERYGEPPWDFVNRILDVCRLDFRVEPPPLHEVGSYEPKLIKLSSDVEMRFQDLSSGEKVLMSFALCMYNAQDARQENPFPKLLLLDEVDAPLHPSMVASLINTIKDVLVEGKNVSVILTTHSPSTAALAPEEALYEMSPSGPSVEKVSASRAVAVLTYGVPTLSVSLEGRRQVFVESKTDARIYERLYQRYKESLDSQRSLVFIEVGKTTASGGESNSGCAQVKRLVSNLAKAGNDSIFGLVDWDGCRASSQRVHVLSPNIRDGLESLLMDPLIVAATVLRENMRFCLDKALIDKEERYSEIVNWSKEKWQAIVDRLQSHVLEKDVSSDEHLEIQYLNGISLNISKSYLHYDDHAIEGAVIAKFGFLNTRSKNAGDLMNHIISTVLNDYPQLLPCDLLETFSGLLEVEV